MWRDAENQAMSFEKDLKDLKLPPETVKKILSAEKDYVRRLKLQKRILEREIRTWTRANRDPKTHKWKSKQALSHVQQLYFQRRKIERKIFRHGGSKKKETEFDSD